MSDKAPLFVAVGELEVHFPAARSLKEKRQALRSLIERLRHRLQVLVLESDYPDLHQRAGLAIAALAVHADAARGTVQKAFDVVHESGLAVVLNEHVQLRQVR